MDRRSFLACLAAAPLLLSLGTGRHRQAPAAASEASTQPVPKLKIRYVCSDAEHTKVYDKPGKCEVCDEFLRADASDEVEVEYFCPKHRSEDPSDEPGTCDVEGCKQSLVARQVQPDAKHKIKYACPNKDHRKRFAKPGECETCGKLLRARDPEGMAFEYVCPEHSDEVVAKTPGYCTVEGCWLFLEARWVQPKLSEKFVYRCPVDEHEQEFDKPGRCPECNMYLEAQASKKVKYVCPHPDHEYFMWRAGKCGVPDCTYYLEARTYVEPEPEKKPWYRAVSDWVKGVFSGGKGEARR